MIGKEDLNEQEPELIVTDKRKFNVDGSLREGVEIAPETPKEEKPAEEITADAPAADEEIAETAEMPADDEEFSREDFPGADDPASFVNFLSTLASQAAAALGAIPHPATGQRTLDLDSGKYWIDVLAMLKEKTEGNLLPPEAHLFEGLLGDLRMQYVELVRATEERLKQQAAQKFSANDILGKK